jgi:hypothetical protein
VKSVGDEDISAAIQRQGFGTAQVVCNRDLAGAQRTASRYLHGIKSGVVHDVEIARSIHCHVFGALEPAGNRDLAGRGGATGRDIHYPVVVRIRNENVSCSVNRYSRWTPRPWVGRVFCTRTEAGDIRKGEGDTRRLRMQGCGAERHKKANGSQYDAKPAAGAHADGAYRQQVKRQ